MSLSVPVRTSGAARPARTIRPPLPAWLARFEAFLARPRTPWQLAGMTLLVLAHTAVVASLLFITPQLVQTIEHRGQPTCDLSHLTVKQALTGAVCVLRLFNVTITGPATGSGATAARP